MKKLKRYIIFNLIAIISCVLMIVIDYSNQIMEFKLVYKNFLILLILIWIPICINKSIAFIRSQKVNLEKFKVVQVCINILIIVSIISLKLNNVIKIYTLILALCYYFIVLVVSLANKNIKRKIRKSNNQSKKNKIYIVSSTSILILYAVCYIVYEINLNNNITGVLILVATFFLIPLCLFCNHFVAFYIKKRKNIYLIILFIIDIINFIGIYYIFVIPLYATVDASYINFFMKTLVILPILIGLVLAKMLNIRGKSLY